MMVLNFYDLAIAEPLQEEAMAINLYSGIGREEAILIAKEFLQKNNLETDYYLSKYKVKLKKGVWNVAFPRRQKVKTFLNIAVSIRIEIDQATGRILGHVIHKGYRIP